MDGLKQKTTAVSASLTHVARMSEVGFSWKSGEPEVPRSLSLEVGRGERLFIGGPSGSGKTTLLGLFAGVLVPQSGSIELLDHQ